MHTARPQTMKTTQNPLQRNGSTSATVVGLIALVAIGVGLYMFVPGCGARAEVAKDKALAKIDEMLGKSEVREKQIEEQLAGLKKASNAARKSKIEAEVAFQQVDEKLKPTRQEIAKANVTLGKLQVHLTSTEPVILGGTEYTSAELKEKTQKVIDLRKKLDAQVAQLEKQQNLYAKVRDTQHARQEAFDAKHHELSQRLEIIKTKAKSLRDMKEARKMMSSTDDSTAESVEKVEADVDAFERELDAALGFENEMFDESQANDKLESAEDIINATQDTESQLDEINALLGTDDGDTTGTASDSKE